MAAIAVVACNPQEEIVPEINVTTTEFTLPVAGTEDMSYKVEFNANVDWTAALKEASEWCSVTPSSGVAGDAAVTVIALENKEEEERSVTLILTAGAAVKEIVLTQEALFVPRLEADESVTIPTAGGSVEFAVNATVEIIASIPKDATWLSCTVDGKKVIFNATENTSKYERAVKVALNNDEYELTDTVAVVQEGTCKTLWAIKMDDVMNRPAQAPMFSTDEKATAVSIALYDGNVVLSAGDGSEPVKLDKATGEKIGTIATGDFKPYTVRQDDAGNLVMSNRVWAKWTAIANSFALAYLAPSTTDPVVLINTGDNDPDGGLREEYLGVIMNVRGDVTSNATIILPHQNGDYAHNVMSVFSVTEGVTTKNNLTMNGFKGVGWAGGCFGTWPHNMPGVALVGPALTDGALTAAYETNVLQRLNLTDGVCTDIASLDEAHPDQSGNYAPTGMDVRVINGKSYLAVAMCSFYGASTYVYLFDMATQELLYAWRNAPSMDPKVAADTNYDYMSVSVTMGAADGGLVLYVADKSSGTIAAQYVKL